MDLNPSTLPTSSKKSQGKGKHMPPANRTKTFIVVNITAGALNVEHKISLEFTLMFIISS
jgi:hypothetical protein